MERMNENRQPRMAHVHQEKGRGGEGNRARGGLIASRGTSEGRSWRTRTDLRRVVESGSRLSKFIALYFCTHVNTLFTLHL